MIIECCNGGAEVCGPLGSTQLQSVIEVAYSLLKLRQVKSAESLLKPFTSELAEVRTTPKDIFTAFGSFPSDIIKYHS